MQRARLLRMALAVATGLGSAGCPETESTASIRTFGDPPRCVGETRSITLEWRDGNQPRVTLDVDYDTDVVRHAVGGMLGPGTVATLEITCVNPGMTTVEVTAIAASAGDRITADEFSFDVTCMLCEDAGVDAGPDAGEDASTPPLRPALEFGGDLLPDELDDFLDSAGGDPAYTGDEIDIEAHGSEVEMQSMADADTDFNMSTYECGETVGTQHTACATDVMPMPAGELLTVVMDLVGDVPLDASDASYIYSLVFDSDQDPANDFTADAAFPQDYFQRTDRWYELVWDHTAGTWSVRVTQLDSGGTRTEVGSSVRAVIDGRRITFFVARSELPGVVPGYRVVAFRHDGAFSVGSRGGDVSMGFSTLPLLPAGCGFVGAECRDDSIDRGLAGSLTTCGDEAACVLVIQPGSFRGACTPSTVTRCGMGAGECAAGLTCASPPDRAGYCLTDTQLECLCATSSGRVVYSVCE